MKYVSYLHPTDGERAGILLDEYEVEYVADLERSQQWAAQTSGRWEHRLLPPSLLRFLELGEQGRDTVRAVVAHLDESVLQNQPFCYPLAEVQLLSPLPAPRSFRDFYAFEEHVKTARGRRGLDMVPEWYDFPVFYFSNHNAFHGPEAEIERPSYSKWLDYELEIACVIGKQGRDIKPEDALDYIAGFTILNDWSARDIQREEVKVGLGPAKGKDFATSMGPFLLTLDELEDVRDGHRWSLEMTAKVNGQELSRGNFRSIYFSFGELIARASDGVMLHPGDVIGSGTVGTGCILELGTDVHRWLEPGDVVEMEIERLGVLRNRIK
jgi:2-keto-4-pentenoate hydratase/2-oxohepta-3-ene-1,7-dioic acid hydratase in catechol pathway